MSDLQCPATLLLTPSDGVARDVAAALAERLAERAVRRVWRAPDEQAQQLARTLSDALDVEAEVLDELHSQAPAETDRALLDRFDSALQQISDLHRGETVLVVVHGDVLRRGVETLARRAPGVRPQHVHPGTVVEVDVDSDGLLCTAWPTS